ncbi:G-protein coupled receptor Mth2-like isoform X4 [Homalodisca vitripennis]|uniref:G-protein coupled receptor Mth2-like isoform X4 n=1 Tax=Homalodisca vitripennis TaxID=197043 RepID=UPI001EEA657F|nr:G-protein coupled receptor Mth2-like isoform X4 [Homalodisca vitripennis]
MKETSVPAAGWCLGLFVVFELFVAFWISFYIICPQCWPFPQKWEPPSSTDLTDPHCPVPPCVRKCCPLGEQLVKEPPNTLCKPTNSSKFSLESVPIWENNNIKEHLVATDYSGFQIINYGLCPFGSYVLDSSYEEDRNALLANGSLVMFKSKEAVDHKDYCIDTFKGKEGTYVFRCFPDQVTGGMTEMEKMVFPVSLTISIPFLLATVFVYLLLPELKNLHGKSLICHVSSLSIAYIFLALMQSNFLYMNVKQPTLCVFCAFVIQFSFLATFFWLNVMCFDIWWVFSGLRPLRGSVKEREHKKFILYSLYAWGCPLVIFVITLVIELVPSIPKSFIKPQFGVDKCWFKTSEALVLYFYLPIGVLVLLNIAMFVTTAFRLRMHTRDTKVLQTSESRRNDEAERQRFNLYLKLFIVMGINWVMELVSFVVGGPKSIWFVTDLGNTLQGLLIFLIFVCKRRILRLLNQKLCPRWELVAPTASSRSKVSPSRTSSSSLSKTVSSNPDGLSLKPIARAASEESDSNN